MFSMLATLFDQKSKQFLLFMMETLINCNLNYVLSKYFQNVF